MNTIITKIRLLLSMIPVLTLLLASSAMADFSQNFPHKRTPISSTFVKSKFILPATLTYEEKIWLMAHPVIRIGVDAGFAPYAFVDNQGKFQGVAADFAQIISEMLGIEMQMVPGLSWPEIIQASKDKTIDLITTASYRPEREAFLNFTEGYIATPLVIMSRSDDMRIKNRADIANLKIAMVKGYNASKSIKNELKGLMLSMWIPL